MVLGAVGSSPCPEARQFPSRNLRAMTDQELIFSALRQVGLTVVKHLEGTGDADEAITQLIAVLDTRELADAMNRVERGYGLRVVK